MATMGSYKTYLLAIPPIKALRPVVDFRRGHFRHSHPPIMGVATYSIVAEVTIYVHLLICPSLL